jgi:acyl carrier protein
MSVQDKIDETVYAAVLQIAQQHNPARQEVAAHHNLRRELRFSSLDFAQLVAILEEQLHIDPFASQVAITSIQTVDDVCVAYRTCMSI